MTTLQNIDPMELARQRVAKGVALLDEKVPGWRAKADPNRLRITSHCNCILGMVFGGFNTGVEILDENPADNGFDLGDIPDPIEWDHLESAWLEELNKQPVKV